MRRQNRTLEVGGYLPRYQTHCQFWMRSADSIPRWRHRTEIDYVVMRQTIATDPDAKAAPDYGLLEHSSIGILMRFVAPKSKVSTLLDLESKASVFFKSMETRATLLCSKHIKLWPTSYAYTVPWLQSIGNMV